MSIISITNLKKHYKQPIKEAGMRGTWNAIFSPKYKEIRAVDEITFNIEEGEIVAFLGPNGAGKTTTLKMLTGILYPTDGDIKVLGYIPKERDKKYLKQIAIVMGQKNQLWWDLPVLDTFNMHRDIYKIEKKMYKKILDELVELLDVKELLNVQAKRLSLGQRMKCEILLALLHKPKILFLDEPTIGLDVETQQKIRIFLKEYNEKTKTTIILTSHNMSDVKAICKRAILINNGKIVYDGRLNELLDRSSDKKYVKLDFEKVVHKKDLLKYGDVIESTPYQANLAIPKENNIKIISEILSELPIDNIDIQDVPLEEIIIKIFKKKE